MSDLLTRVLAQLKLDRHEETLTRFSRPSVRLDARPCGDDELGMGASRFGGVPDLPPGFAWPLFRKKPLSFLAQVDLGAIPPGAPTGLPRAGWLVFFCDAERLPWGFEPKDRGAAVVMHVTAKPGALRRAGPPGRASATRQFHTCQMSFTRCLDFPDPSDPLFEQMELNLNDAERAAYGSLCAAFSGRGRGAVIYHHLGGLPQPLQGDMRDQCQLVTHGIPCNGPEAFESKKAQALLDDSGDWRLLLQLDTDEDSPGFQWGAAGRLYFWIRSQDLKAQRFGEGWALLQSA